MPSKISVWWDGEADSLEVILDDGEGVMKPTKDRRMMVKVDNEGNILGFHILGVTKTAKQKPFEVDLVPVEAIKE